ncbi:SAM pointed domain-containing Ets transcription factor-like [Galendromus occidentalis]|uniref:SAM pointed domain-containing Ets transcription factor-like n=1 Tax=Galendromus occidentalis TaxID=34638 RepID=A0AAJ6QNP9_9ACAR|nr:SAM pointed domain-containing Ets transcription factor-like [Galendromus occidentalis]
MMMEQTSLPFQSSSFYPSPSWSPPSSEATFGMVSNYIKSEPLSPEQTLMTNMSPRVQNTPCSLTPPPTNYPSSQYAPLTPPYRYEQNNNFPQNNNSNNNNNSSSYWQTSTPPPYEDYFSEAQYAEREYTDAPISDRTGCLEELNDEGALEQLRAICLQQAAMDVKLACHMLNISPNPYSWDMHDVQRWILWLIKEKRLECSAEQMHLFYKVSGAQFVSWCDKMVNNQQLSSAQRTMVEAISAHLDIWKSAAQAMQSSRPEMETPENFSQPSPPRYEDSYSDDDDSSSASQGCSTQHIHLWQFLKELLSDAQQHGACIRWLDRGIFKIEDSVRVAKLWGRRKNRPAMNYDKLSRSIRQYYRKGIMKKTERSQRLVYQFCPAYAN